MPKTDPKDSPGNVNLETHPLVAKLHADPDQLSGLVALGGYLGPSKREGYVRLYGDLSFRNYYEIPTAGIVSTSPTDASDENSPTTVHVASDTQVDKVSITSQSTEARFLQGSIASGYLGGAGAGVDVGCSWPASPTCWCGSHTCQPGVMQAAQPYTDTVYHTCACSIENYTCNNCGQAGAQANVQAWPASPTCWCNITRNCNQQAAQPDTNTVGYTCVCTLAKCGQAAAPGQVGAWPVTGGCHYTQWQACGQAGAQANAQYWTMGGTCACATWIQCNTSEGCT
jgi:hypothetical protein